MSRTSHKVAFAALTLAVSLAGGTASAADPSTGQCLTANAQGAQLRRAHQLQEARAQMLVCAASSCPAEVQAECARRVSDLNAAIPTVAFELKDGAGNDLTGVKITVDGAPLTDHAEGAAVPVDPGEHKFSFEAAGQPPVEKTLVVVEGVKDRRERIVIGAAPPPAPAAAPPAPVPAVPAASPSVATTSSEPGADAGARGGQGMKTLGLVSAGVGVAGVVVGSVFGVQSYSKWSSAQQNCESATNCTNHAQAVSDHDSASTAATISTIGFVAGGVLIATGAVLWFAAPGASQAASTPTVGVVPGLGGMLVRGTF